MKKIFTLKRVFYFSLLSLSLSLLILWFANHTIESNAPGKTVEIVKDVPHFKSGLLLGTSKYNKGEHLNVYYTQRISAAAKFYKAGKLYDRYRAKIFR